MASDWNQKACSVHKQTKTQTRRVDTLSSPRCQNIGADSDFTWAPMILCVSIQPEPGQYTQRAHTCTENVFKTRFQDVQNVNSEDIHMTKITCSP